MDIGTKKVILETFLTAHGIEMLATARLAHYGRRFTAFFPEIAKAVNPESKAWTDKAITRLVEHIQSQNPQDHKKTSAEKFKPTARYKQGNRVKEFFNSWEWKRLRMEVIKDYGRVCQCCGTLPGIPLPSGAISRIQVDHIQPISKRWDLRLDRSNLQCLCSECNKGKGAWDRTDWRNV